MGAVIFMLLCCLLYRVSCSAEPEHNSSSLNDIPPPPVLKGAVSASGSARLVRRADTSKLDTAALYHRRAMLALGKDDLDEAEKDFEKFLDAKPTDTQTLDQLADICERRNDIQGTYTYTWLADRINRGLWLSIDPQNEKRTAKIKQLEEKMKATIKENGGGNFTTKDWWPRDLEKSINCRALHLYGMGDGKYALRLFQEVLRLNSGNSDALFNIGVICEQQKSYTRAQEYYKAAMQAGHMDAGAKEALLSCGQKEIRFRGGVTKLESKLNEKSHFSCNLCRILRGQIMDCN